MTGIRISVVIPTKNRHDDLLVALCSIAAQTMYPDEIVIVDQSAEEIGRARRDSVERQFDGKSQVVWIHDRSISGLVAAKREGANRAAGDIVCFLEDDIVLESEFISAIVGSLERDRDLVGCSGVVTDVPFGRVHAFLHGIFHRGLFFDPRPWVYANWRHLAPNPIPTVALSGGLSAWRNWIFDRVPFDTVNGFHMLEDIDFSTRVALAMGGRLAIIPTARLEHHFAPAGRTSLGHRECRKVHEYITFLRTRPHRGVDLLWLVWVLVGVALSAAAAAVRNRSMLPVLGVFRGLREGVRRRIVALPIVSKQVDAPAPTPVPSCYPDPPGSPPQ